MNGLMEFASVPPPGNALPEFNEDEEYGDFGTLFIDEQQIDFEEYYESLLYFKIIDNLTSSNRGDGMLNQLPMVHWS